MTDDNRSTALPRRLALLWRGRDDRGRGRKPSLTLEEIVDAAIGIAESDGLDAVSMSRVASELDRSPMALYRYVDSKEDLLFLMWNSGGKGVPEITGRTWREKLASWGTAQFELLGVQSWLLQMPWSTPPSGPRSLDWVEQAIAALEGTGLGDGEKLGVIGLIATYSLSEARMAHDASTAEEQPDFAAVLREVVDADSYPHLHRAAWSGELDVPEGVDDAAESFRFGLDCILDGVDAMIKRAAAARGRRERPSARRS